LRYTLNAFNEVSYGKLSTLVRLRITCYNHKVHNDTEFSKAQIPLGSSRHFSTRLDTFDVSSPCILAVSSLLNSTARHAGHDELDWLDTSNVEFGLNSKFTPTANDTAWSVRQLI